jgi:hypothetical protein
MLRPSGGRCVISRLRQSHVCAVSIKVTSESRLCRVTYQGYVRVTSVPCQELDHTSRYFSGRSQEELLHRIPACRKRRLKGKRCAYGYSWATLSPGDTNTEAWFSRLGVGRGANNPTPLKTNFYEIWISNSRTDLFKTERKMITGFENWIMERTIPILKT